MGRQSTRASRQRRRDFFLVAGAIRRGGGRDGTEWADRRNETGNLLLRPVNELAERRKEVTRSVCRKGSAHARRARERRPSGAASRKLAIWVGGDETVFNHHKTVLDTIGDRAAYIGPIGSATVAKLVHNMSGYAIVCALAETFTLGVKAGIDPLTLWQAVRQGAVGRRFTFDALLDQFLPGEYDPPAFALKLAHKDVSLANALGRELGMPMRLCNLTLAEMTEALARGWGGRDSRAVMLLQQERAGVEIAVDRERLRAALAPAAEKT